MQLSVPPDFLGNVASNTTSMISSVSHPVELIIGILLAFLIVDMIVHSLTVDRNDGQE